jgi:acyl dehydratase
VPANRAPDIFVTLPNANNSVMIFRLSGDLNPLHIGADVAHTSGFDAPILNDLATDGVVGRSFLSVLVDNDTSCGRRMEVRFSRLVQPSETIRTEI